MNPLHACPDKVLGKILYLAGDEARVSTVSKQFHNALLHAYGEQYDSLKRRSQSFNRIIEQMGVAPTDNPLKKEVLQRIRRVEILSKDLCFMGLRPKWEAVLSERGIPCDFYRDTAAILGPDRDLSKLSLQHLNRLALLLAQRRADVLRGFFQRLARYIPQVRSALTILKLRTLSPIDGAEKLRKWIPSYAGQKVLKRVEEVDDPLWGIPPEIWSFKGFTYSAQLDALYIAVIYNDARAIIEMIWSPNLQPPLAEEKIARVLLMVYLDVNVPLLRELKKYPPFRDPSVDELPIGCSDEESIARRPIEPEDRAMYEELKQFRHFKYLDAVKLCRAIKRWAKMGDWEIVRELLDLQGAYEMEFDEMEDVIGLATQQGQQGIISRISALQTNVLAVATEDGEKEVTHLPQSRNLNF